MADFLVFDLSSDNVLEHLGEQALTSDIDSYQCESVMTGKFLYPDLAELGGHHERRHAVVVEHRLQVAVWVQLGALDQQQVVHLCEETRVVLGVVCDVHQSVQHRVAT